MQKKDIQVLTKALLPFMKKVIKTEVKKVMKPLLREMVENEVNKILAEQFLNTISRSKPSLMESVELEGESKSNTITEKEERRARQKMEENRRKEILAKIGADKDPTLRMIFEDVGVDDVDSSSSGMGTYEDPLEGDDEGIDISQFGY